MLKGLTILVLLAAGTVGDSGQKNQSSNLPAHDGDNHGDQPASLVNNQKNTTAPNEQTAQGQSPHWYALPEWWLCILGVPTLVFLGWQAGETRRAANAGRRQSEIASNTAKRQLRAYLCVDQACVKITGETEESIRLEAQLHIKNGGQTPAYSVQSWLYGHIGAYPENAPVSPPPKGLPRGIAIIPAQGKNIFTSKEIGIFPQIMVGLDTPTIPTTYYVQGEVRYRDIFGDWHCLKIRMFYGGPAKTRKTKDSNGVMIGFLGPDSWGNSEEDIPEPEGDQKPN